MVVEPKCRPQFVDGEGRGEGATIEMLDLRHPCIINDHFIPNDIVIGTGDSGQQGRLVLLTGPNMGGKSTLLRQTCLAVVLAQLGCYIPARHCRLSPIDRIFTRLGASDNIVGGQSTFMAELLDASKILHEATPHSLVILDELGRGTSTFDGMAIAHAVLLYLAHVICCLGLFATHYRPLALDFAQDPVVKLCYMDCHLDRDSRRVTFLYHLAPGISPKSYGMNVALMAGLPSTVIDEAERVAEQFDQDLSLTEHHQTRTRHLSFLLLEHLIHRKGIKNKTIFRDSLNAMPIHNRQSVVGCGME